VLFYDSSEGRGGPRMLKIDRGQSMLPTATRLNETARIVRLPFYSCSGDFCHFFEQLSQGFDCTYRQVTLPISVMMIFLQFHR